MKGAKETLEILTFLLSLQKSFKDFLFNNLNLPRCENSNSYFIWIQRWTTYKKCPSMDFSKVFFFFFNSKSHLGL